MCSRFLKSVALLLALTTCAAAADLRVCADPEAMPSSNAKQQGFDNRIIQVIARDLHATVVYEWQRNGRGFIRDVLNKGACDVVLGVPSGVRGMLTTTPYYRSGYVFVTRRDRDATLRTFDDPALKNMKIGVQVLTDEYAPPGQALGRRGLVANIVGFEMSGNPASIVNAVYRKKVDTAIVWGPLAGYYARLHPGAFEITPTPSIDPPVPMAFSIALGVSKRNAALRDRLNAAIERQKPAITRILRSYGVPLLDENARAQ